MALFGFNKQKVLSAAEKYVQQGKLQNAIAEYEKVLKNDAKDLTVTNTVGDLYSRLGETDKATACFKTVGDAYASQGFTVKAIAMYKKICKLQPSLESLLKLAELYSQQGLFNDARAQYLQVAEEFLKANELENAVRIFQKIVEMDPENSGMRVRLAEVYIRLGKKTEAWQIFSAAAESLRSKGSLSGAEEILQRMLTLDPGNTYALLMQGKNMIESGDAAGAVATLQKISDIDSHPDGLRDLFKAYLQAGQLSEAGTIANKLLTVHNDLPAISSFAEALMQAGQYETALQVFDEHAERLLAENSDKVLESLHAIIGHVRDNPDSLQKLLDLFHKAGENTHVTEVLELLAHASVQAGDLPRARDLYQRLATLEPQNTLHMQNYQQVAGQLGGTSGGKLITPDEAVVLIDDLEATAPAVHQHYTDEISLSIRSALTDAELFISYNMPAKALGPLVGALPLAPSDLRINQRLAALHTRAGRFAEAAVCCRTLQSVYSEGGYPEEATRYGELAERYEERSSAPPPGPASEEEHIFLDAPATVRSGHVVRQSLVEEAPESEVPEFSVADASAEATSEVTVEEVAVAEESAPAASPWPTAAAPEFAVVDESASATTEPSADAEIDLSSEWDDSLAVEAETPAEELAAEPQAVEVAKPTPTRKAAAPSKIKVEKSREEDSTKSDETVEEIRFYLGHGMPEQALAALAKLQTLTSDQSKLAELRSEVDAAIQAAAEEDAPAAVEPVVEELTADDIPTLEVEAPEVVVAEVSPNTAPEVGVAEAEAPEVKALEVEVENVPVADLAVDDAPVSVEEAVTAAVPEAPAVEEIPVEEIPVAEEPPVAAAPRPVIHKPAPKRVSPAVQQPAPPAVPPPSLAVSEPELQPGRLNEFVSDLESSPGESFLPGAGAASAAPQTAPAPAIHLPATSAQTEPVVAGGALGEFVADIEASLGADFLAAAPVAQPSLAATTVAASVGGAKTTPPLAASAAASASANHVAPIAPLAAPQSSAPPAAASIAWHAPASPAAQPSAGLITPSAAMTAPAPIDSSAKSSPFSEDAGVDLAEMFGELKQDLEADVASADEDPETHYNLGIAFREMGLLDEAIGELQKACQSFDHGKPFPQIMQTYTWLAQCFLEKGVPEAAIRWYQKALEVPRIDGETRVALHYELASAYEAAGDKSSALQHFMDVYGSNIDYRDVAERIKALKS
ncbi:MAG TPA: tetratricopeptide repeat protein [Candidatus Sulfotelmatobacter sp.]|jgi:tetratricopeptide (TPR) repeat protein